MARKIEPLPDQLKWSHLYLTALEGEASFKKQRETYRKHLLPFITDYSDPDENGNYFFEFPSPVIVGDDMVRYKGLMAQRRVSEWIDDDKAREIIQEHNLEDRCIKQVVSEYIDYDELYAANQEGIISDEEIDSILEISESYALVKVKE